VIQFHGLDVPPGAGAGTPGEVDGTGGYIAGLPVSAAPLIGAGVPGIEAVTADRLASDPARGQILHHHQGHDLIASR
jgi:hypothetical protein